MHLATLALLQVVQFPNGTVFRDKEARHYSYGEWQCTTLPSAFTRDALMKKCPNLIGLLNVCCAVWNDCYEQRKGEAYCNKQQYNCNQIVLSTASPEDFQQCRQFPAELKDHLEYTSPRPDTFYIPPPTLHMQYVSHIGEVYESCRNKKRTFSACIYNHYRDNEIISRGFELRRAGNTLKAFNLRMCMEMTLEPEDGEECQQRVQELLQPYDKMAFYNNTINEIRDRSSWKCGANRFDTYITQVVVGMKCKWLKEAFNTCCKHQAECYQEFQSKYKCDKAWDSCNKVLITNCDGSTVQECEPFAEWIDNFKTLNNVYVYQKESRIQEEIDAKKSQLYFWNIVFGCTLILLLSIFLVGSVCCRQKKELPYQPYQQKLSTTESLMKL